MWKIRLIAISLLGETLFAAHLASAQPPLSLSQPIARARAHNPDAGSAAVAEREAVRFHPMALAGSVMIVGAAVILFDPIFQGLAISLMAGDVASPLLSRMAVPVLYYVAKRHRRIQPVPTSVPMEAAS